MGDWGIHSSFPHYLKSFQFSRVATLMCGTVLFFVIQRLLSWYGVKILISKESRWKWNAGDIPEIKFENVAGNSISSWEQLHGLEPRNKYPKIYYKPNCTDLSDVFLVDVSTISRDYDREKLLEKMKILKRTSR